MDWEPVFILGVTGGVLLVSVVHTVIQGNRTAPRQHRPAAPDPRRRASPAAAAPRRGQDRRGRIATPDNDLRRRAA